MHYLDVHGAVGDLLEVTGIFKHLGMRVVVGEDLMDALAVPGVRGITYVGVIWIFIDHCHLYHQRFLNGAPVRFFFGQTCNGELTGKSGILSMCHLLVGKHAPPYIGRGLRCYTKLLKITVQGPAIQILRGFPYTHGIRAGQILALAE